MSRNFYWQRPNQWGWWKLNDDATDSSGNARDGTASGVTYGPGRFGKSGIFTGSEGDRISFTLWGPPTTFTISLWYKGADTAGRAFLFGYDGVYMAYAGGQDQYCGYCLQLASGVIQLRMANNCYSSGIEYLTGPAVNDNNWHWIVGTRDDDFSRLFVDGYQVDENAGPLSPLFGGGAYYRFFGMGAAYVPGYTPLSLGYFPTCKMDAVELLTTALSKKDVRRRYEFMAGAL